MRGHGSNDLTEPRHVITGWLPVSIPVMQMRCDALRAVANRTMIGRALLK